MLIRKRTFISSAVFSNSTTINLNKLRPSLYQSKLLFSSEADCANIKQMSTTNFEEGKGGDETSLRLERHKPKNVIFKVPYGQLAGHEWGNPSAINKIICLHGWLDNCASFQPLIPHLLEHKNIQNKLHIVAFDYSGVGFSSHRPVGTEYNQMGHIFDIKRVIEQLNWESYSIIGHSMGGNLGFLYSCIFPNEVQSLVSIDLAGPISRPDKDWTDDLAKSIKEQLVFEKQIDNNPATNFKIGILTEEEAIDKLINSHGFSLNHKSAEIMLSRGAKKESWGYIFNRDLRLRSRVAEFWPNENFINDLLKDTFKAKLLVILAKESYLYPRAITYEKIEQMFDIYKKQCSVFKSVWLPGTHHLHMNEPEPVANHIAEFFIDAKVVRNNSSKL